jgi:CBS domain-containing protein
MKVADVMTRAVITVGPEASWQEVTRRMLDAGVSGVPVTDPEGSLLGIVTEADLMTKPAFGRRRQRSLAAFVELVTGDAGLVAKAMAATAGDLMTAPAITASPGEGIGAAALRMLDRSLKHLPVVDRGRLVGIVSRRDLLRTLTAVTTAPASPPPD